MAIHVHIIVFVYHAVGMIDQDCTSCCYLHLFHISKGGLTSAVVHRLLGLRAGDMSSSKQQLCISCRRLSCWHAALSRRKAACIADLAQEFHARTMETPHTL